MDKDIKYLVGLNNFTKFGPQRLKKLKNHFQNWQNAFKGDTDELIKAGIEPNIANEFTAARLRIDLDSLQKKIEAEKIKILTLDDENYPKLLKEIYNPPFLFYYRGDFSDQDEYAIAIVGSRKISNYGQQAAELIAKDLALSGFTVVSGLALGIDSIAHHSTLINKGRTIAVLGSGLDRQSIYPSANRYLADKIESAGGLIISEFPLGTPPLKHHFPQRNRIISGLSLGTLVIEANEKSGALITAEFALEQNRDVFALPGSIFSPLSVGPNKLIKKGAQAITSAKDIIETLDLTQIANYIENKKIIPGTKEEELILSILSHDPLHINELVRQSGLDTSQINSTLIMMEMKGMVKNLGGMKYVICS